MKSDIRHRTRFGTLFRFFIRGLGLLGVLAAAAGVCILAIERRDVFGLRKLDQIEPTLRPLVEGTAGLTPQVGAILLAAGLAAVVLWALVELIGGLALVAGRKSAAGAAGMVQVGLAAALLVIVNALSFDHYWRSDRTRDQRFTLEPALIEQLKQLDPNSPTTVVVLQMDKTSALEPEQSDALTTAAQQKITEKVLDLIDELREQPELSARFNVHVIHTKDEAFDTKLAALTATTPAPVDESDRDRKAREAANRERTALKAAIASAPENSIFVTGNGRVQRLPFNQFYMLDKTASQGADGRYANLVLSPQGKAAFVRKMLELEQRKPKVALLTIHPFLTSREADEEGAVFTAAGLRTALEQNGYEVSDIVLKKGWDGDSPGGPTPAAATYDESKLEEVEADFLAASDALTEATIQAQAFEVMKKRTETGTLAELDRVFRKAVGRAVTTEADREMLLKRLIQPNLELWQSSAEEAKKQLAEKEPEYLKYLSDDRVLGSRRSNDVKAKLAAAVADCDLLVIPRLTTVNLVGRFVITPSLFNLVKDQTDAVKEFVKAGKPVLFGLGPTQVGRAPRPGDEAGDEVEKMLARLGIEAGTQTIITPVEAAEMAKRRTAGAFGGKMPELPPLQVDLKPTGGKPPHPVAVALDQTARTVRKKVEVKKSGYRPLYLSPAVAGRMAYSPELLLTAADAWNEDRPLMEGNYVPKYEPTKPDDAKKGTREEEKKQPYLVGVAAEVPVPTEWTNPSSATFGKLAAAVVGGGPLGVGLSLGTAASLLSPDGLDADPSRQMVRIAVFGHGGLFNGPKLEPGQEALLLHTVNWQLKRDDRLPADVPDADKWRYPRAPLDEKQQLYWLWGAVAGVPLLVAFLGIIALMIRWLR